MDKKFMKKGLSIIEVLVSLSVVATAVVLIATSAVTSNAAIQKSDATAFFDNRNLNATATFKTNPDINFLKTQIPFKDMKYDEATMTFSQGFDKNLKALADVPFSDPAVFYKTEYRISITEKPENGFRFENKEIKLELSNYRKEEGESTFKLLSNSVSNGSVTIHTNYLNESSVNPPPTDPTDPTDPTNPTDPTDPTDPTEPEREYYYLTFRLSGGKFAETGNDILVKMVPAGKKYGDQIEVNEGEWKTILPEEGTDFTNKPEYTGLFSGWSYADGSGTVSANHIVDGDKTLIGSYSQERNNTIGMIATVEGRDFWDITSSELGFYEQAGNLYLKVKEGLTTAGTPAHNETEFNVNLGEVSVYKNQIRNAYDLLPVTLELSYNYVDVQSFMGRHQELALAYGGTLASAAVSSLYDGSGAKFTITDEALEDLGTIFGMKGAAVNVTLTPIKKDVDRTVRESRVSRNYAALLDLGGVSSENRIDNEEYRIKFVKNQNPDTQGRVTYQIQLLGQNGDNIMNPNRESDAEWGTTIYVSKNLYFDGEIDSIDTFTFLEWARGAGDFVPRFADPVTAEGSDIQVNHVLFARHRSQIHQITATKPSGDGAGGAFLQMYGSMQNGIAYSFGWFTHKNDHPTSGGTWTSTVETEVGIGLPVGFSIIKK